MPVTDLHPLAALCTPKWERVSDAVDEYQNYLARTPPPTAAAPRRRSTWRNCHSPCPRSRSSTRRRRPSPSPTCTSQTRPARGVRLAVDGLPDLDGINTALAKERKRAKELADALKKFEGVDVEEYRGLKDKRDEIEQQHQLAHGNYNDAVAKATEKMQADFTKQVRSLTDRLGTIEQERNQALADLKRYNIERELERAAVKLRVRPE